MPTKLRDAASECLLAIAHIRPRCGDAGEVASAWAELILERELPPIGVQNLPTTLVRPPAPVIEPLGARLVVHWRVEGPFPSSGAEW